MLQSTDRPTDLLALPVPPRDPAAPITAVLNLIHLGELITDASSVTALRAHEGDEVERAKVNLEELLQAVWLYCYLWTPGAIALLEVQPGQHREGRRGMFMLEIHQEREKSRGRRKIRTGWRGEGERKSTSECGGGLQFLTAC